MKMRAALFTLASFGATAAVIANAFIQKEQFYPSIVYLTRSQASMAVIYVQAFIIVLLAGQLLRKIFFGELRVAETEHLFERFWYAITETCLAFTVFRDDFSPRFVALFVLLLFFKCFHWLAEDRIDFMERSPVITLKFHMRAISLLGFLTAVDLWFFRMAYQSTILKGATVQLVFGFEYAVLLACVLHITVKYVLHTFDSQRTTPWDNKAVFMLYAELLVNFFYVVLYSLFFLIMVRLHMFPLFAVRPLYLTLRAFKKSLQDAILSRRAINNMNTLYPNATTEELAAADVCIICRDELSVGCKKLPCGHVFHTGCMRSWFQRQQTCPTCRLDVLRTTPSAGSAAAAARRAANPAAAPNPAAQPATTTTASAPTLAAPNGVAGGGAPRPPYFVPGMMAPGMMPPPLPPGAFPMPGMFPHPASQASTSGDLSASSSSQPNTAASMIPPFMPPPPFSAFPRPLFPLPPPYQTPQFAAPRQFSPNLPFPQPPLNLNALSDAEVAAMEGRERQHVEARVECLRNIQTLLDAAVIQMQQYSDLVSSLNTPEQPPPRTPTGGTPNDTPNSKQVASSDTLGGEAMTATSGKAPAVTAANSMKVDAGSIPTAASAQETPSVGGSSPSTSSDSELRQRRLERFTDPTTPAT